jgi:hypothetical protein
MNKQLPLITFSLLVLCSANTFSQWNANPALNTSVCATTKNQQNLNVVTDGKGGAIIAWEDSRNSTLTQTDIYVQRIDKNGNAKWTINGITVCSNDSDQAAIGIAADGKGGAILIWGDTRNGKKDIYAQKVDSTGVIQWAANGVAVCMKAGAQSAPKIISDGTGGGIVVWEDSLAANPDIYAQRISSAGAIMWAAAGVGICTNSLSQNNPRITSDSVGGAVIVWQDFRNGNDYDIYAQRVNASGTALWTAQGALVCNAVGTQNNPKVKPDGSSGAIIAWVDKRGVAHDVYAQRMSASGAPQWTANGVVICNATGSQSALAITTSGISGAIIAWKDQRSGAYEDVYVQKISLTGAVAWAANGIAIASGPLSQKNVSIAGDGSGGAIMVWQDSSATGWDVYAQKVDGSGAKQWTAAGVPIGTAAGDQTYPDNVSDGGGGCIFAFQDKRNTLDFDVYAHHLYSNGTTVNTVHEQDVLTESKCFPNPFSESTTIEIKDLVLGIKDLKLQVYDIFGKEINLSVMRNAEGFVIHRNGLPSGVYFYEIRMENNRISKGKLILAD